MSLRYLTRKNWTLYLALNVARRKERSGRSKFAKKSNKEPKKISASNVNFLRRLLRKPMKKNLKKLHPIPILIMPTINSTIISMELIMDTIISSSLTTPPTKAVGDQHRPQLNTLLEERSHKCNFICNRLRPSHKIRLKYTRMNTYLRFNRKNLSHSRRDTSLVSRRGMKKIKRKYSKYTG